MKTAVIQFNATNDKEKNLTRALRMVERAIAKKAKFILLPEVFIYRGSLSKKSTIAQVAEKIPGPSTKPFMDLAKKSKVFILAGSIIEKSPKPTKVYNTSVLINDKGKVIGKYRKINLFEAKIGRKKVREANHVMNGKRPVMAKVKEFKVGLSVCYDLRFPGLYQKYSKAGAHVLCVPSAFTDQTGRAHWKSLLRARAIENLCYILAPNQIGKDAKGILNHGHSMIISPWGEILAEASGNKEEIIISDLDMLYLKGKRLTLSR